MSKPKKQFDFSKFKQRHIVLKVLYFGWDYDGLATQQDNENTIEFHLFQALTKTCLIESRALCNYNRCGRTDKGVSSYGQVVDLNIRSNLVDEEDPQNIGLFTPERFSCDNVISSERKQELDYVEILNRVLPDHIKTIAWAPVNRDFSSRFSCQSRSYSYIFPLGDLCLESMQRSLTYLVGEHDFRNLCSFDLKHGVTNHKRTIISAHIQPLRTIDSNHDQSNAILSYQTNCYKFYEVVVVGQAFLYHQIRCIMTIIFLVGTKKESPEVVRDLLDIKKVPAKPNYNKASPMPLCLFDCRYKASDLPLGWNYNLATIANLLRQLKNLWLKYKTKTLMIERVLLDLDDMIRDDEKSSENPVTKRPKLELNRWKDFGLECDNMSDLKYVPLLKRPRDQTLESKLETIKCKEKILSSPRD